MKKTPMMLKPRNPLVAPVLFRKAGRHERTNKAQRRADNALLRKLVPSAGKGGETIHDMTAFDTRVVMSWVVSA